MASPRSDEGVAKLRGICGMPVPEEGTVSCLKCLRDFESPDRKRIRICNGCKLGVDWKGSQEADNLYPNVQTPPEQKLKPGNKGPRAIVGRGRIIRAATKKKARTKEQKLFGNAPLSKKRTRV